MHSLIQITYILSHENPSFRINEWSLNTLILQIKTNAKVPALHHMKINGVL